MIRIVMRVLLGWYRKRGRELGLAGAETGAVSFVQRFGGSMNCHTHLHAIVIDGVYSMQQEATTRFHFVEPPSAQELASLVATICERVCRMLGRRGLMECWLRIRAGVERSFPGRDGPTMTASHGARSRTG